jgi:hypothetical protein
MKKTATLPLSWTWGSYTVGIGSPNLTSAPLVLAPLGAFVRRRIRPDILNNPLSQALTVAEPALGYEESFSFNVQSAGAVAATLLREYSIDEVAWFNIDTTALAVAAGPAGATTNNVQSSTLRRFPAYPFLRYTITNNDAVNAITLNFILTLRAA